MRIPGISHENWGSHLNIPDKHPDSYGATDINLPRRDVPEDVRQLFNKRAAEIDHNLKAMNDLVSTYLGLEKRETPHLGMTALINSYKQVQNCPTFNSELLEDNEIKTLDDIYWYVGSISKEELQEMDKALNEDPLIHYSSRFYRKVVKNALDLAVSDNKLALPVQKGSVRVIRGQLNEEQQKEVETIRALANDAISALKKEKPNAASSEKVAAAAGAVSKYVFSDNCRLF